MLAMRFTSISYDDTEGMLQLTADSYGVAEIALTLTFTDMKIGVLELSSCQAFA